MAGAGAVYHLAPNVHPDEVGIAARVVAAADGGRWCRGWCSTRCCTRTTPAMPHHLRKADAEAVVRAGLPAWTILQPAAYLQNLLGAALAGRIEVPYSLDAPFTNVDLADVAEVAARVLHRAGPRAGDLRAGRTADHGAGPGRGGDAGAGPRGRGRRGRPAGVGARAGRGAARAGSGRPARDVRGLRRPRAGRQRPGADHAARPACTHRRDVWPRRADQPSSTTSTVGS